MDYPPIRKSASEVAARHQAVYKRLAGASLVLLCAAALLAALSAVFRPLSSGSTIAIASAFGASWLAQSGGHYEKWFDGRAVAESVKTASWRYAMAANPYSAETEADALLSAELAQIASSSALVRPLLDVSWEACMCATDRMRSLRASRWELRRAAYLKERVEDQKIWYSAKARDNRRSARALEMALALCSAIAVASAACFAMSADCPVDWSAPFLTACSSLMAWAQVKQSAQLSHSYGVAATELADIEAKFQHLGSDAEFVELVDQAELAMSREHTLWVARNAL